MAPNDFRILKLMNKIEAAMVQGNPVYIFGCQDIPKRSRLEAHQSFRTESLNWRIFLSGVRQDLQTHH
jgi:hypothetical protein